MCYGIAMDVCPGIPTLYLSVNLHRLEKKLGMCLGKVISCITKMLLELSALMFWKTCYGKVFSFDEVLAFVTCTNLYFVHAQNKFERISCITAGLMVGVNFV